MTPDAAFAEAERLLRAGDAAGAERALISVWPNEHGAPAAVAHVYGLVRRAQNRLADAETCLRRAARLAPKEPSHHAALGDLLAQAGYHAQAAACFKAALALNAGFPGAHRGLARALLASGHACEAETAARQALALEPSEELWELLARALRMQDRLEEALAATDAALRLKPDNAPARHSRGVTLARLGRNEEALRELDALAARGVSAPALWLNRGVALLNLTRAADAEAMFAEGIARWPRDQDLHNALANVRWMRGEGEAFTRDYESAVARTPEATHLRIACADLLRRAEFKSRAEDLLREGLAAAPQHPALLGSLGVLLDELDRTAEALPLLERTVALAPQISAYRANLACALLRLGRGDQALQQIAPARAAEPLNQEWICYETMALRQLGDPRYQVLCDYERMVRAYDLAPPPGFASIAAFNEALRCSLNRLHVLESHPLDQSLRHGSQTTRSLLYVDDPVIQAYLKGLAEPINAYMASMGARDPGHPWSGRNTGRFRLSGCWSAKLKPKGFHINHLHPEGWISSAYYVAVPETTRTGADQQGWIKFGEPRWPTPGCTVEKAVQPQAGRLVLFPSYMWHGTIPFDQGERITAPFDAVPA